MFCPASKIFRMLLLASQKLENMAVCNAGLHHYVTAGGTTDWGVLEGKVTFPQPISLHDRRVEGNCQEWSLFQLGVMTYGLH